MLVAGFGAFFFGLLLGWIAYRTLRLKAGTGVLADIVALAGVLVGAGITALFRSDVLFGLYSIGLTIGFLAYVVLDLLYGNQGASSWRMVVVPPSAAPIPPPDAHASGIGTGAETESTDITGS
jgi:uncharacterized membrane protein YeaQ/YmgE (transglycosylase-associated protein family)